MLSFQIFKYLKGIFSDLWVHSPGTIAGRLPVLHVAGSRPGFFSPLILPPTNSVPIGQHFQIEMMMEICSNELIRATDKVLYYS